MQTKKLHSPLSRLGVGKRVGKSANGPLARLVPAPKRASSSLVPVGPALPDRTRSRGPAKPQAASGSGGSTIRTLSLFVLLPTLCAFVYFAFVQSRQYVAESRFVIRSATESKGAALTDALSMLSKLGGSSAKSTVQDGFIVTDYVRSRAVVADIGGKPYVSSLFARPEIDFMSRLAPDASIEEVWKYWAKHVTTSLDTISGVVTVRVQAYTPQDALSVNEQILKLCEGLINTISDRSRADSVRRAESEVGTSSNRLVDAKRQLLDYRNRNVLIDPVAKGSTIGDLIGKLTIKRIEIENNLSAVAGSLNSDAPSQRLLTSQKATIDRQIEDLKQQLTGDRNASRVSAEIGEFEQLKLNEMFTQRMYQIAQSSYEKARQEAAKQQLFLVTVVKPLMPEEALYPKVGIDTFLFFALTLIFWSIGSLLVASIRDHLE